MSRAAPRRVRARAHAKINLTLRVLGVHADGYHELRTTFQSIALHDTLTFEAARGPFVITSNDRQCPTDETNLVWKAAERLWKAARRPGELRGVRVHIVKRIPLQAGLGGGSSDAAATLRALRMLWKLGTSDLEFSEMARRLGADIAFFLEGGTVLGVERGDLLFPLQDTEPAWVVLARPEFGVSTKDAYAWWDAAHLSSEGKVARGGPRVERVNDLERPVTRRHPEIATLIARLRREGADYAVMSGSGSAVYGLFRGEALARRAAGRMTAADVTTWVTRTLSRRKYLRVSAPTAF